MRVRIAAFAVIAAWAPLTLRAQHSAAGAAPAFTTRAPREAQQYDFLVGEWELTVKPKVSGLVAFVHGAPRMHGSWKAWRALDGWGIEDELRIVDESGNPKALTHFVRIYDATAKRWTISATEVYRQQHTSSTAQWQDREMVATGEGVDGDGKTYTTRTRVSAITPASFRYQQDRSYDGGKSWDEGRLVIEAKRVAATVTTR